MEPAGTGAASPEGPRTRVRPVFDTPNILWFFGALTAAFAGAVVIESVHSSVRGLWILLAALAFLGVYAVLAFVLLRLGWEIPGGVVAATGVTFVPVAAGAGMASGLPNGTAATPTLHGPAPTALVASTRNE